MIHTSCLGTFKTAYNAYMNFNSTDPAARKVAWDKIFPFVQACISDPQTAAKIMDTSLAYLHDFRYSPTKYPQCEWEAVRYWFGQSLGSSLIPQDIKDFLAAAYEQEFYAMKQKIGFKGFSK
jgi:hypothetical protein